MKTLPGGLAAHIALKSTTLATALKITRADATVVGFTSADANATISGVLYKALPGLDATNVLTSASLGVDNLELTTLDDGTVFTKADVLGGVWRNATFVLFRYNWANLADGIDTLLTGTLGEGQLLRNTVVFEMRGLQQYLNEPVGSVSMKLCRARLGDTLCTVNMVPFTFTGSVTSFSSAQVFTDSTKAQAANYFTEGELTWTSGPNAGRVVKVKTFSGSVFTLALPMLQAIAIGHTFSVKAGCMKRIDEDCIVKFNNVLNFQGEPHRPLTNDLTKPAEPAL